MKKYLFCSVLALTAVLFSACDLLNNDPEVRKLVVSTTVTDITNKSAVLNLQANTSAQYAAVVVTMDEWNQIKQDYFLPAEQNKALVASAKANLSLTDQEFVSQLCQKGNATKTISGLNRNTEYAVVAFAYTNADTLGSRNFTTSFRTSNEEDLGLEFAQVNITNYTAQFDVVPLDSTKFYYVSLYEKGYVEEAFEGELINSDFDFNETEIGLLEYEYEYETGYEPTPYQLASIYMKQGTSRATFTGLKRNTEYTIIGFYYDYESDQADTVLYRTDFKTTDVEGQKNYSVVLNIGLEWNGTTLKATPDDTTKLYYFDALPSSVTSRYSTVDELAEAVVASNTGGKMALSACSKGVDSYDFSPLCAYYSSETTIVGFAFGVDSNGKICSQPVMLSTTNPSYSATTYDSYYTPKRYNSTTKRFK